MYFTRPARATHANVPVARCLSARANDETTALQGNRTASERARSQTTTKPHVSNSLANMLDQATRKGQQKQSNVQTAWPPSAPLGPIHRTNAVHETLSLHTHSYGQGLQGVRTWCCVLRDTYM